MVPLDYVLAVAILTTPPIGEETTALPEHRCIARTIQEVALHWQVLDPRESFSGNFADFDSDLALVRRRYQELADAPDLSDAQRFPHRDSASAMLTFNREYYRTLKQQHEALGGSGEAWTEALEEVDQLYKVWDLVRDARSDCYYVSARRQALLALLRALGPRDYYRGVLPPHVPVWRFERRD